VIIAAGGASDGAKGLGQGIEEGTLVVSVKSEEGMAFKIERGRICLTGAVG